MDDESNDHKITLSIDKFYWNMRGIFVKLNRFAG